MARVEIVRTRNEVNVTLHSGRPGVVIGPRGGEVDKLREEIESLIQRKVTVNVVEIKDPDLNATLVAQGIAEQLGKRASFRRTMKQYCEGAMNAGARGVKIMCSGRLAGSEMARTETQKMGSIPLHTLDADVDYALGTAPAHGRRRRRRGFTCATGDSRRLRRHAPIDAAEGTHQPMDAVTPERCEQPARIDDEAG